ncbi:MAG: DegV family EDD domain-containing protein, partial [Erysipelotrichia bacterium]|nr:DegV family EDD domain-containing protein [Erysipelotrichia bacterium]
MSRLVIADSSCDMRTKPGELEIVPLTIMLGVDQYVDDENLHLETMLNRLREYKGPSSTACPSVQSWLNAYLKADECFVVTMTSGLSGTYNSARVASDMCLQEFPDKKIVLFDTLSTGEEMVLLIEKLNEWIAENKTFEEIQRLGTDYLSTTHLMFMLKSLHNLASNG